MIDDPFKRDPYHLDDTVLAMKALRDKVPDLRSIVITDVRDPATLTFLRGFTDTLFELPRSGSSGYLSALLAVIPMQRMAYDMTLALGYDPDRPRNLAKELTTK